MKAARIWAAGLAAVVAVSTLGGCGSPAGTKDAQKDGNAAGQSAEKTVIKFWGHQNAPWEIAYEDMIAKFEEKYPEYDVQTEYYPYNDYQTKIQTSLMSKGDGADVYSMWGGWALDFGRTGALAEVPAEYVQNLEDDFYEPTLAAYRHDGKYYGVPMEYNLEYGGMLVNKKLFEEAGLTYPTTWEELEKISDQVSKANGNVMEMRGFDFVSVDSLFTLWLSMILSEGGQYLNEDGTVDFNTDIAISTMEQLKSYVTDRHWSNMDSLAQWTDGYRLVYEGKSFMFPMGCWSVAFGETTYGVKYGEDYDYVALPPYGSETAFVAETGWGLAVPEASRQQEGAWKLVEFLTDPENLMDINIACTQIPPRRSMLENAESREKYLNAMPYAECLLDILDKGQWVGPYNTEAFKLELGTMFVTLCSTDEYGSVEEALARLTDTINQMKLD